FYSALCHQDTKSLCLKKSLCFFEPLPFLANRSGNSLHSDRLRSSLLSTASTRHLPNCLRRNETSDYSSSLHPILHSALPNNAARVLILKCRLQASSRSFCLCYNNNHEWLRA